VLWVGRARAPDRARVIAIGGFRFKMRVAPGKCYDGNAGFAGDRVIDGLLAPNREKS
jgi:hypothetical protein